MKRIPQTPRKDWADQLGCGDIVKKALSERTHECACGCQCGRDENAAKTILRWMTEGDFWSGTGQVGAQSA